MASPLTPEQFAASYNLAAPAATPQAAPQPQFLAYVTGPADRWDTIAWKAYGDPTLVSGLILSNPTLPISPVLPPGVTLYCPLIAAPAPPPSSLPWAP